MSGSVIVQYRASAPDAVPEQYRACVLLGYGNLTGEQMRRGVELLAKAWGLDDF